MKKLINFVDLDLDKSLGKFNGEILNIYVLNSKLALKLNVNENDYIFMNNLYLTESDLKGY